MKLTLRTRSSPEVLNLVALHQCDVGIAAVPASAPGVETELLASFDIVCAMPTGHPLCAERVIGPAHLAGARFLAISESSPVRQRLTKVFEVSGVTPNAIVESSYSAPICSMIAQGLGIAVLEPLTAHAHRHLGIELRPFEPSIPFEVRAVFAAGHPSEDRTRAFVALVKAQLSEPFAAESSP